MLGIWKSVSQTGGALDPKGITRLLWRGGFSRAVAVGWAPGSEGSAIPSSSIEIRVALYVVGVITFSRGAGRHSLKYFQRGPSKKKFENLCGRTNADHSRYNFKGSLSLLLLIFLCIYYTAPCMCMAFYNTCKNR